MPRTYNRIYTRSNPHARGDSSHLRGARGLAPLGSLALLKSGVVNSNSCGVALGRELHTDPDVDDPPIELAVRPSGLLSAECARVRPHVRRRIAIAFSIGAGVNTARSGSAVTRPRRSRRPRAVPTSTWTPTPNSSCRKRLNDACGWCRRYHINEGEESTGAKRDFEAHGAGVWCAPVTRPRSFQRAVAAAAAPASRLRVGRPTTRRPPAYCRGGGGGRGGGTRAARAARWS